MRVNEIIKKVAELAGREELYEFLCSGVSSDYKAFQKEKDMLLHSLYFCLCEIASEKAELIEVEKIELVNERLYINSLKHKLHKIKGITFNGKSVKYDVFPEYILVKDCDSVEITYAYLPNPCGSEDEIKLPHYVTEQAVVFGTLAEYYLECNLFDEALYWRGYFEKAMQNVYPKAKYIRPRSFV